jgi:hypothetical protein
MMKTDMWGKGDWFPFTQLYFSIYYKFIHIAATYFGRTTIFRWKHIQQKLIRLTTDPIQTPKIKIMWCQYKSNASQHHMIVIF